MRINKKLSDEELKILDSYLRATNFLSAAQVYLRDNCLLEEPLRFEDIKNRLLGHWGTAPGINFIYTHLNNLIKKHAANILLVTGPGHGAAANLANLFLEGALEEYYPELTHSKAGVNKLIKMFSVPAGFPSHLFPGTPGTIHEGGELGYALATSFGAVLDNPNLICACIVGDGEAETGPTATAWHSIKFLNPLTDGAVLPILHVNRYKISSETIFGAMSDQELMQLFTGYGYNVKIVKAKGDSLEERTVSHQDMAEALEESYLDLAKLKSERFTNRPQWPMIILCSPKGWTGPKEVDNKQIEGSFRSHQVPAANCKTDSKHLKAIENWFRSYKPEELFSEDGCPKDIVLKACPPRELAMGRNPYALGGNLRKELKLPDFRKYSVNVTAPGAIEAKDMEEVSKYLRDVVFANEETKNFRFFCPDEMTSNKLTSVFEATTRQFQWPTNPSDDFMAKSGRVMEMLSEHNCQAWLQGYLLTGRHGIFPCYEAFAPIVDSMMNQYAKFLKVAGEIPWRKPWSSLNYILTSEGWRQDHNGYSHQGPGFIDNLLTKKAKNVRIYLPPDANCLISTVDHCLTSLDKINLVIASKQKMPQWLTMEEAVSHCRNGVSIWKWASTNEGNNPDIVLAASGVYPTAEIIAAAQILRKEIPDLKIRVVNITDLLILERDSFHPHGLSDIAFNDLFPEDKPVIYNFHGYPNAIKQLIFHRPNQERFVISGYIEEGTTTTPFDLLVRNGVSRFDIVMRAVKAAAVQKPNFSNVADRVISRYIQKLSAHRKYIEENGIDPPEVLNWKWIND